MTKGIDKSQGELLLRLYAEMLADLECKYPSASKSFHRDVQELTLRYAHEGVSFFTKALPKLGKALDRSLETQRLAVPREFKRSHGNRNIPAFMSAMFSRCFDADGCLDLDEPEVLADLRQVLYLGYKIELPYAADQERSVIQAFLDAEVELKGVEIDRESQTMRCAREIVTLVLGDDASEEVAGFDPVDILPRHGPGAVATGEKLERKWLFSRQYSNLTAAYPFHEFFMAGSDVELSDRFEWYQNLEQPRAGIAKVVLVPKDSRGPRLISCEPLEYQWIQQGLGRKLVAHLESHWLTKDRVNFTSQDVNRSLALESSKTREFSTMDLKEASDRVSLELVRFLFPKRILPFLEACRTPATRLPDGSIVQMTKFAPMGSALCFPVEALVFWAICVAVESIWTQTPYSLAAQRIRVYGDDLIVPSERFDLFVSALESVGLRVNRDKSFVKGEFRESCGCDAFRGVDVTPLKLRTLWSGKPTDASAYVSFISYANAFGRRGYHRAASFLWCLIEELYGKVPWGLPESGYPCREVQSSFKAIELNELFGHRMRWNAAYQRVEVSAKFLAERREPAGLDGWPRLLRNLTVPEQTEPDVVVHPRCTQIKKGWRRL